jgi:peptidoglycan/xylan/chitin deacetylase (PgdA/CDA1 family)
MSSRPYEPSTSGRRLPGDDTGVSMDRRRALRTVAVVAAGLASAAACAPGTPPAGSGSSAEPGPSPARSPDPGHGPGRDPVALPPELVSGPVDRPAVALTFHGQGDAALARQLLAELERGGAKATVLAVGSWLDMQPEMAGRVLDGGHELGNHTQHHLDIAAMDAAAAFVEINMCAQRLQRLTGSIGSWFRPSQTRHATPVIQAQAARVGYATCLSYDLDSLDFTDPGAAAIARNVLGSVHGGSIVSLHFGHAGTVAAMPEMLDGLRQRGLRAVTVTDLVRGVSGVR